MKKLFILLLLSVINLYGQSQSENKEIIVKLFIISPCYPPELDSGAYLVKHKPAYTDSLNTKNYYEAENGIISVPVPGKYSLFCSEEMEPLFEIEINNPGVYEYKRYVSKISALQYISGIGLIYKDCGEICEGYVEDFYENGNLRIRGNFSNGSPKDSLVEFYHNGKVHNKTIIKKKKKTIFTYDSIGNLVIRSWSSELHGDSKFTMYYPNGRIRYDRSDSNNIVKKDTYYPDGARKVKQRKKYKVQYYKNGNIKSIIKWTKRKDFEGYKFTINSTFFKETGELEKTEEDIDYGPHRQPPFAYDSWDY